MMGFSLFENPLLPERMARISTKPGNFISPEFRRSHDKWLEETFGTVPYVVKVGNSVFGHPATIAALRRVVES